jgi:hypothetical protein
MSLIKFVQKNWVDILLALVVIALVIQIAAPELFTAKFWRSCGKEKFADDVTVDTPDEKPAEKPATPAKAPVETKSVETKSVETKSVETKSVDTSSVDTSSVDTKTVNTTDTAKTTDSTESKATTDTTSLETKVNKAVDVATNAALASVAAAQQSSNSASQAVQAAKQASDVAQSTPPIVVVPATKPAQPATAPASVVIVPKSVAPAPPVAQPPVVVPPPVIAPKSVVAPPQLQPSLQVRSAQPGPIVANQAELMQNRPITVVDVVPQGNSTNVIPENMYLLDGANQNFNFAKSRCSKSCCSQQWPLPFAMKNDPAVCNSKEKYVPTGLSCTNSWDDSGCLCVTEEQARFYGNRGGNA